MSSGSPGIASSPAMRRGRCRSPAVHSKLSTSVTPGTRCLVFLRRCLAIQLQKVGLFPNSTSSSVSVSCASSCENHPERDVPLYWMYDSGYLIFQGFLEANLKCFWNGALIEAMKVLEFQGYISPGVLLVSGTACALEVVRAAWARNVLKPPNNYVITVVGDVEDCLVEPISQGQFTPLPEALCWIILDMTASGQAAVMESICSTLQVAFPDIQKPSKQVVYDTLAKLTAEKKLYQTSNGYFVMTPDKLRLSGLTSGVSGGKKDYHVDTYSQKQLLLTPEEAVVKMHGEIETVRDGNVTHQAIQTNLADVICGGNPNDKILYPRVSSKMRSGYSAERLERRHSLRFFGHGRRRSQSLQRTGSFKHIDKSDRLQNCTAKESPATSEDMTRKHTSLFSRLFRRSGRMRRDDSPSPISRPTFSAQFPPAEWFNRGVTHLHSVGTQTTYLAPSTDTLPKRSFNEYDFDEDLSLNQDILHKRHLSAFGTPRMIRRTSHSATLPRRSLAKKSSLYNVSSDKEASASASASISRISSQTSVVPNPSMNGDTCDTPRTSSHSSIASSAKTVINNKENHKSCASPTHKSLSSASSGYNSLPRSDYGSVRNSRLNRSSSKKNQQGKNKASSTTTAAESASSKVPESSITFHVSAKSSTQGISDSSTGSTGNETNATTMTTTINSGNKTKIFLQQHNTPTRSLITFENSTLDKRNSEKDAGHDIIIVNQPSYNNNNEQSYDGKLLKPARPTSLYAEQQNNLLKSNKQASRILETQLRMKYPSTETIQLEEKSLETISKDKRVNNEKCNVLHDLDSCKVQSTKNLYGFGSETELNNAKNTLLSQNSNVVSLDKINNLKNNNLLNDDDIKSKYHRDTINSEPASPVNCEFRSKRKFVGNDLTNKNSNNEIRLEKDLDSLNLEDSKIRHFADFPSLSDLSLRFTSIAAQNILKGVSFNSVDTLVEVNMAAEKKRNCDLSISTDLGMV
ncbi:uncharacterized protein knockout [Planococcus citri]|uniref:uncharacterized protein knockout n=1 Tax=Planococcus citri TaxID=170843 RepID=UPI0031F9B549